MTKRTQIQFEQECNHIRDLHKMGYTTSQILEATKLKKATYWYYMKRIHEADRKAYEEHLGVAIPHEIMILKDKFAMLEQRAAELYTESQDISEKIEIIRLIKELSIERVKIDYEGPDLLNDSRFKAINTKLEEKEPQYHY